MTRTEWFVHPNRSEVGPDEPGQNGHYRSVTRPRKVPIEPCLARVELPGSLAAVADPDGSITFGGYDWWFVVGAARTFARTHISPDVPPPFGFKLDGKWYWWDNTTTDESILDDGAGIEYVREFLDRLFPGLSITFSDNR